ncbi:MAG: FKBP-type peptidyl-prolyl cis-trans isomerase N-terminal domain-containing protein [Pseudomonadota bacterium]
MNKLLLFIVSLLLVTPVVAPVALADSQAITLAEASKASGLVNGAQQRVLKEGIDVKQLALGMEEAYRLPPNEERLQLANQNSAELAISSPKNRQTKQALLQASFDFGLVLAMNIKQLFKILAIPEFIEGFKKSYKQGISSPQSAAASIVVSNYLQQQRLLGAEERLLKSQAFLAENAKRKDVVTTKSGLQYEILEPGNGAKPTVLDMVKMSYRDAKLNDDFSFPFTDEFSQEIYALRGDIPEGWRELFLLMNKNARYRVFLSPALGFGVAGVGEQVLPNEVFITEFTLLDIIPPPPVNY